MNNPTDGEGDSTEILIRDADLDALDVRDREGERFTAKRIQVLAEEVLEQDGCTHVAYPATAMTEDGLVRAQVFTVLRGGGAEGPRFEVGLQMWPDETQQRVAGTEVP